MATLEDIQRLVRNYGKDILDDERRAHAIICDWHPHETVRFDEVSRLCGQWKKGKRPSVIYIDDEDPEPPLDESSLSSMAQSCYGAGSFFTQAMYGLGSAMVGKNLTKAGRKTTKPKKKDTRSGNANTPSAKTHTKSATKKKGIVLSANGNSISIEGDNISVKQGGNTISVNQGGENISVKQTFKSGVSTKTISIHIDTTKSYRAN